MAEYRADLVTDTAPPDQPLWSEYFTARDQDAAFRMARRLLKPHLADPRAQYGELWVRDPDGGLSAEYMGQFEVSEAGRGPEPVAAASSGQAGPPAGGADALTRARDAYRAACGQVDRASAEVDRLEGEPLRPGEDPDTRDEAIWQAIERRTAAKAEAQRRHQQLQDAAQAAPQAGTGDPAGQVPPLTEEAFLAALARSHGLSFSAGGYGGGQWALIENPGVPGDAVLFDFRDHTWNHLGTREKITGTQVSEFLERHQSAPGGNSPASTTATQTGGDHMTVTGESYTHAAWRVQAGNVLDALKRLQAAADTQLASLRGQDAGRSQIEGTQEWHNKIADAVAYGERLIDDVDTAQRPVGEAVAGAGGVDEVTENKGYYSEGGHGGPPPGSAEGGFAQAPPPGAARSGARPPRA